MTIKSTGLILSLLMVLAIELTAMPRHLEANDYFRPPCPGRHVVMIKGVVGYWPNVDHLAEAIMASGMTTSIHKPLSAIRSADDIACYCRENTGCQVSVVAYSLGADAAIVLCEKLQEQGITVDCLVLIEATFKKNEVPENVRYCYNLYEERGVRDCFPAFRGVPVDASSPATVMTNNELSTTDLPARRISHFNIASRECTHRVVLQQLLICNGCVY